MKRSLIPNLLAAVLLAACGNPTPTFYKLSSDGPLPSGGGTGIGVGPISLADYVDRQNIVVQSGPNKIRLAESHLWAGDLDNAISRVVATNLGRRLGTGNVRTYPWQRDSEIDYQVAIDIREFIAGDDGFAHIEASWRIYALPGSRIVGSKTFIASEAVMSEDYEAVVAAESRLLGKLSDAIAAEIKAR